MLDKDGLTPKQASFCEEYLIDLNASQAAIRAGYSTKNTSSIAAQIMSKTKVRNAIAREMAARSRRTGITQDRVLRELARVAFVNPSDVIDFDTGTVRGTAGADDLAAVSSCKVKTMSMGDDGDMVEREIKLNDKIKALDLLCRHLGMYPDGKGTININPGGGDGDEQTTGVVLMPAVMQLTPPKDNESEDPNAKTD